MAAKEVNQHSSLPPYTEMIMKAIESLGENGGNKSMISKYIKSTYGELPPTHSTLLSTHLKKMKESGEVVIWKSNYMKPNPNAPPKRGRGRPPKPKVPISSGTVLSQPRPRGRPPKDPNVSPKSRSVRMSNGSGKPRGRPKKVARTCMTSIPSSTRRPRGRPSKMIMKAIEALGKKGGNKLAISKYIESTYGDLLPTHSKLLSSHLNKMKKSGEIVLIKNNYMKPNPNSPLKKGRGRPPKPKVPVSSSTILSQPRPRGRPPRDSNVPPKSRSVIMSNGRGKPRGRPKKVVRTGMTSMPSSTRGPRVMLPKMIMKAIEALGENGGNKSAISKYIKTTYGKLCPTHSTLLSTHLNKMKEKGEIVIWKNNYMKSNSNVAPKRGRGRPPKPKIPIPSDAILSLPRLRGRPPKDPNSTSAKVSSGSDKPRGRPKKIARTEMTSIPSIGRLRGRPPKVRSELEVGDEN